MLKNGAIYCTLAHKSTILDKEFAEISKISKFLLEIGAYGENGRILGVGVNGIDPFFKTHLASRRKNGPMPLAPTKHRSRSPFIM